MWLFVPWFTSFIRVAKISKLGKLLESSCKRVARLKEELTWNWFGSAQFVHSGFMPNETKYTASALTSALEAN